MNVKIQDKILKRVQNDILGHAELVSASHLDFELDLTFEL